MILGTLRRACGRIYLVSGSCQRLVALLVDFEIAMQVSFERTTRCDCRLRTVITRACECSVDEMPPMNFRSSKLDNKSCNQLCFPRDFKISCHGSYQVDSRSAQVSLSLPVSANAG